MNEEIIKLIVEGYNKEREIIYSHFKDTGSAIVFTRMKEIDEIIKRLLTPK